MEQVKFNSLRPLLLALLFSAFFSASKHLSSVAPINPFADDPYDAIGSFAVQLAWFLGLLSIVRGFRPDNGVPPSGQIALIAKGRMLTAMSVCLTMLGDLVALFRHLDLWASSRQGKLLAAATIALLLIGLEEFRESHRQAMSRRNLLVSFISSMGVLAVLAIYPEQLRQTFVGALATVLAGIVMLFLPLGLTARERSPGGDHSSDALYDLTAMCASLTTRARRLHPVDAALNLVQRLRLFAWIDPRTHKWRLCLLVGIICGLALAAAELGSGSNPGLSRVLLVVAVFVSLETAGVAVGFSLLAKPLGLIRKAGNHPAS